MNQILKIQKILNRSARTLGKPRSKSNYELGSYLGTLVLFDIDHLPLPEGLGLDHSFKCHEEFLKSVEMSTPIILLAVILPFNSFKELKVISPSETYLPFQIGYVYCDEASIESHFGSFNDLTLRRAKKLIEREIYDITDPILNRSDNHFDPDENILGISNGYVLISNK